MRIRGIVPWLIAVALTLAFVGHVVRAADPAEVPITIKIDEGAEPFTTELVEGDDPEMVAARKRLTIKERRRLGLTFRNVRRTVKELQAEGAWDEGDRAGMSVLVLNRIVEDNPQAFQDVEGDFDWDGFLEFITRLLELFEKFAIIFS